MRIGALLILLASACRAPPDAPPIPPPASPSPASVTSASTATATDPAPSTRAAPEPSEGAPLREKVASDWCIDGLETLDADTCYFLPPAHPHTALLIYLHGIVPPLARSPQKETVESTVRNAAARAGYAAMIPRGRRGIGPGTSKDWYAWPTTAADYAKYAQALVISWKEKRDALAAIAGAPFARTYLAGSSNGAYFLTALAFHSAARGADRQATLGGVLGVDGFGAMSGGSAAGWTPAQLGVAAKSPFYVGYGAYDETNTGPKALGALLVATGWPHQIAVHPVAHGAKEVYLDEAFAFWDKIPH